jgi:hypothetical protein
MIKKIKNDFIFIYVYILTNIIVYAIRYQIKGTFSFKIYNQKYFIKLFESLLSSLIIKYIFRILKFNNKINIFLKENYLIEITLSYICVSTIKRFLKDLKTGQNTFNIFWLRNIGIVIGSSLFLKAVILPFIPKNNKKEYKTIIDVIQSLFVTFMLDYFIDLKIDHPRELTFASLTVIIEDLIEKKLKI